MIYATLRSRPGSEDSDVRVRAVDEGQGDLRRAVGVGGGLEVDKIVHPRELLLDDGGDPLLHHSALAPG